MTPEDRATMIGEWLKDKELSIPMLATCLELALAAAVAEERERCAKIVERYDGVTRIAAAVRETAK